MINNEHKKNLRLFVRFVAGECNEKERQEVLALIAVDERKARLLDQIQCIYTLPESAEDNYKYDADAAWKRMREKVFNEDTTSPALRLIRSKDTEAPSSQTIINPELEKKERNHARPSHTRPARFLFHYGYAIGMAALLVGIIVISVILGDQMTQGSEPLAQDRVFATGPGERLTVQLPDGSVIQLNVDSKLALRAAATTERRLVLQGEAFFDVARDESRPFILETQNADVKVLGTSFGVRSYEDEKATRVIVTEGNVFVKAGLRDSVALRPHQMTMATDDGPLRIEPVGKDSRYLSWTDGRLVFHKASFDEVARELERWYDLDVDLNGPPARVGRLNASFSDEPMSEILNIIAQALSLEYEREGRRVVFSAAKPYQL